jgi:tetratricopeptide (TPR) repeat protein
MAAGQDSAVSRKLDRIDRLEQWIEAVERHEFGASDDPLMRVASWDRLTLFNVWIDLNAVVSLAREPSVRVFATPRETEPFSGIFRIPAQKRPSRVVSYNRDEMKRLLAIAAEVKDHGGENRLLTRGAALHADIVMVQGGQVQVPEPSQRPRSSQLMLFLVDGQQTGVDDASVHWEMGRRLLDRVRSKSARTAAPDPGADETVRLWYLASTTFMQGVEQLDAWHIDRALQLFPQDPEVLFMAACGRELFSGPQIQNTLLSTTLSRDLFDLYGTEDEELRKAERLFRESLERDQTRTEARIRLGRVLGRRGRHQEAIVELRRATMETKNRLLQYYGQIFLGAEAAALDLVDEARRAYERAAELYPAAQSPYLAISALAARTGNRAEALSAIESVLAGDEAVLSDDPWWTYYTSQARGLDGILTALREALKETER